MTCAPLTSSRTRSAVARSLRRTRALIQRYRVQGRQAQQDGRTAEMALAYRMEQFYETTLLGAREILAVLSR